MLRQGREREVAELVASRPGALRPLMGRLWDPDAEIRRRAALAVGLAAEAREDLGLEIVRRLIWALNDESATNGVYGIPALGAIGARRPALIRPFVGRLASLARDDGLRVELLRALREIAAAEPSLVAPHLETLTGFVNPSNHDEADLMERLAASAGGGRNHDG